MKPYYPASFKRLSGQGDRNQPKGWPIWSVTVAGMLRDGGRFGPKNAPIYYFSLIRNNLDKTKQLLAQ